MDRETVKNKNSRPGKISKDKIVEKKSKKPESVKAEMAYNPASVVRRSGK